MSEFASLEWVNTVDGALQPGDWPASLMQDSPAFAVENARQASVMVPVFRHQDAWHVLYIRRCQRDGDRHSGQVAFPGGGRDATDADAIATALREAHEEISLDPGEVSVLSPLAEYHTVSNYIVTPVVAIVPWPHEYRPQPTEVDRIFSIPLAWLADQRNVEVRDRRYRPGDDPSLRALDLKVVYFKHYDGELLWGATARMTIAFLKSLYQGEIVLPDYG